MNLGERLRQLMTEKNKTAEQVGSAAGIEASTVQQILNGDIKRPPDERLRGFATELGVSFKSLLALIPANLREATAPFLEAIESDGAGLKWRIRVIKAGKSGNNNLYPNATLREAVPMFDGVRVFVKPDAEHIKGQGKSFDRLIGRLSEPRFIEGQGKDNGEIQATLSLLASAGDVPAKLREAYDSGMSDLFGFSIDADAKAKRRGRFTEATQFIKVHSVDLIIEPGAGGELIKLIESINPKENADMALRQRMIEAIKTANKGSLPEGLDIDSDESLEIAYREALQPDKPKPAPASTVTADDVDERLRMMEARAETRVLLEDSGLPGPVANKLRNTFANTENYTIQRVTEAIAEEREVLAKLTESGHVVGLGGAATTTVDRSDKVTEMMDDFFDPSKASGSFRECYVEVTGDKGVTGLMQHCNVAKLREAVGGEDHFREAISAATFGNILGDAITRAMVRDYSTNNNYSDWRDLVDIVQVNDFRTQERVRMGGYGNLPAVAENGSYDPLTSPSDEKATYAVSKRGGTETVSIETISNDDVGLIRRVPQRLSVSAARTLYEFVLDFLATNPTVYDAVALFHATHGNLATAALDATSFAAARLAMKRQTEADSAKVLGILLKHIYVPAELEEAAFNMFVRNTNQDETFVESRKPMVHVVDYWTDANNWFATADKRETPLIEIGFLNGNEQPELFIQDTPSQGSLFSNDQIKYKLRHIYGGNVLDYRGIHGSIVI